MHLPSSPASDLPPVPDGLDRKPQHQDEAADGAAATEDEVDLSCESVAGEEDPGASLDLPPTRPHPLAAAQNVPE